MAENISTDDHRTRVEIIIDNIELKDMDPTAVVNLRSADALGGEFDTERVRLMNALSGRNLDNSYEMYGDVAEDGYTEQNVLEATMMLYKQLKELYKAPMARVIMSRLPTRIYLNGLHSASNRETKLADVAGIDRTTLPNATEMKAKGVSEEEAKEIEVSLRTYVPYKMLTVAANMLGSKLSKRMLVRMCVKQMKFLNDIPANQSKSTFAKSINKFGIDLDDENYQGISTEWLFFGADLHPGFPVDKRIGYRNIRDDIFVRSKEQASKTSVRRPF